MRKALLEKKACTEYQKSLDLISRIYSGSATDEELKAIFEDVVWYLTNTPSGTIDNYCNKYHKGVLRAAMEKYPSIFDADYFDALVDKKTTGYIDSLYYHFSLLTQKQKKMCSRDLKNLGEFLMTLSNIMNRKKEDKENDYVISNSFRITK